MDHLIPTRRPDLAIINKRKKKSYRIVDFVLPVDDRMNIKENKKRDKYFDLSAN